MINGLDLFTGIGGLTLALSDWVKPVAYCEIDKYAQGVIRSRIADGLLPDAYIHNDIKNLNGEGLKNVDIIYGGFPCQDISVAGNGKGLAGERSGLFYEILRLAKEIGPTFIFLENVPAIRLRGLASVGHELALAGYDCRWLSLSAQEIGAPHKRERWFCLCKRWRPLADPLSPGNGPQFGAMGGQEKERESEQTMPFGGSCAALANPDSLPVWSQQECQQWSSDKTQPKHVGWWEAEPAVGRVVNGLPYRLDRLKCLGNGVVPAQAKEAFKRLMGLA
jgi:DNA (cytosine-5)-methyltransferase 1